MVNKSELEDLRAFKKDTDTFVQQAFEWSSALGHQYLLAHLYDLQATIESTINQLTKENDNASL